MSNLDTKFMTVAGKATFNDLKLPAYEDLDSMKSAIKSLHKVNSVWKYIDSTETTIFSSSVNVKHVFKINKQYGRIGDYWLQVQLPANTYVARTLSSAIKEVKWTCGDFEQKYKGEDIAMMLAHLNKKVEADIIAGYENNSASAVSASTWFAIPLWFLGSKLLFSMNSAIDDPQNIFFPNHKLLADLELTIEFNTLGKFVTSGSNASGAVRLRFKQYDFMEDKAVPNYGKEQSPSTFVAPYFYSYPYSVSLTDATETSKDINLQKNDGEITEILIKIATNANYGATAPLLYTTEGIDKLQFKIGNDYIYEGLTPIDIKCQYFNEYCHAHAMDLATAAKNFYVMDMSESPMLLHNGSVGGLGINLVNENPVIILTPTANSLSATASTLYVMPIFKALYTIESTGILRRITKLG